MKILAFGASNSKKSINKRLATHAAGLVEGGQVEVLDLNDYELPLFGVDREEELGSPELAKDFFAKIGDSDALVVSFAEHNGSYSAAYKNLFDWCSRIDQKVFQNKPMVVLAASPGPGGARNVLAAAVGSAPHFAGDVRAQMSVPSFHDNFDSESGELKNQDLKDQLAAAMAKLNE